MVAVVGSLELVERLNFLYEFFPAGKMVDGPPRAAASRALAAGAGRVGVLRAAVRRLVDARGAGAAALVSGDAAPAVTLAAVVVLAAAGL